MCCSSHGGVRFRLGFERDSPPSLLIPLLVSSVESSNWTGRIVSDYVKIWAFVKLCARTPTAITTELSDLHFESLFAESIAISFASSLNMGGIVISVSLVNQATIARTRTIATAATRFKMENVAPLNGVTWVLFGDVGILRISASSSLFVNSCRWRRGCG